MLVTPTVEYHKNLFLELLLFMLYVNDMFQTVSCHIFFYVDNSCLMYQHRNVKVIEKN